MNALAVVFESSISLGNVLTAVTFLVFAVAAFVSLKERSATNTLLTAQLKLRLDTCALEQIKERVDTLWIFQLRRGLSEVEQQGLGVRHSPLKLSDEANQALAHLVPELKTFYQSINGDQIGIVDLAVKIEEKFGRRMSEEVCPVCQVTQAGCLILAIGQLRPITMEAIDDSEALSLSAIGQSLEICNMPTPLPIRKALLKLTA